MQEARRRHGYSCSSARHHVCRCGEEAAAYLALLPKEKIAKAMPKPMARVITMLMIGIK